MGHPRTLALDPYSHVFEEFEPRERVTATEAIQTARAEFDVREEYAAADAAEEDEASVAASILEADAEIRTPDPFITSEVLYQLSYVGEASQSVAARFSRHTPSL